MAQRVNRLPRMGTWHAPTRRGPYGPLSGAAKYPAGARPSKCYYYYYCYLQNLMFCRSLVITSARSGGASETMPAGPDRVSATEIWPPAIHDLPRMWDSSRRPTAALVALRRYISHLKSDFFQIYASVSPNPHSGFPIFEQLWLPRLSLPAAYLATWIFGPFFHARGR
jgi:hypothetical protein